MTDPWQQTIDIDQTISISAIEVNMDFKVNEIKLLNSGWDNVVFEVNRDLIFRFPRREFGLICMENEIAALPYIQKHLSFPISAPKWIGNPSTYYPHYFAGYQKIQGQAVCEAYDNLIDDKNFAITLALFLQELHQVKLNPGIVLKGQYEWKLDVIHRLKNVKNYEKFPEFFASAGIKKNDIKEVEDKISHFKFHSFKPCYVHGDLYARHVMVQNNKPIGLIDLGDIHIGHPGIDFAIALIFTDAAFDAFLNVYPYPDEDTKNIMLMHGFCHGMAFLPYAYREENHELILWANLVLHRAMEKILA